MVYDTLDRYMDELEDECHISRLKVHKLVEALTESRKVVSDYYELMNQDIDSQPLIKKIDEAIKYAKTN